VYVWQRVSIGNGSLLQRFRHHFVPRLRKGAALLSTAVVLFVGYAVPLIDSNSAETRSSHFEIPGGPASEHPDHNHAFCAILGATPVLPGESPQPAVTCIVERRTHPVQSQLTPDGFSRTTRRSRAPPSL
jgi:hypothetical protein